LVIGDITGSKLAWGDFDNDGWLDFIVTGESGYRYVSRLLRNKGDGTFSTNLVAGLPDVANGSVAWGDADNDGRMDLLLTGVTNGGSGTIARLYRNNGDGTFTNMGIGLPGLQSSSVAWGDYDNDGHLDFVVAGTMAGIPGTITRIYRNQGDGTFVDITAGLPGVKNGSVAWGDYDNDGYLDLLLTGDRGYGTASVYHNNGDGTFTDIGAGLPGVSYSSGAWGDFNNDGFLDILLAGRMGNSSITRVYVNNRDGTFSDVQAGLPGIWYGSADWGDFDNDGKLDLLLAWDGFTRVYQNITSVRKEPPAPPRGLETTILPHNNVDFRWTAPSATSTACSNGVYYNLRVGTSPGGIQVVSPQADLGSGMRRLAAFGNAGHTNHWFLSHLPRGTYYWSVQTIDPGFAGSAFVPEASFTITNDVDLASDQQPIALPQSVSLAEDASIPITLTGSDPDGDALTYSIFRPPAHGTLRGTPPHLLYSPVTNYFGPDSFEFRANDGLLTSPAATIAHGSYLNSTGRQQRPCRRTGQKHSAGDNLMDYTSFYSDKALAIPGNGVVLRKTRYSFIRPFAESCLGK